MAMIFTFYKQGSRARKDRLPPSFFKMIFIFSIIVGLQCSVNVLLYSKVTQSLTHTHTHTHTHAHARTRTHSTYFSLIAPQPCMLSRYRTLASPNPNSSSSCADPGLLLCVSPQSVGPPSHSHLLWCLSSCPLLLPSRTQSDMEGLRLCSLSQPFPFKSHSAGKFRPRSFPQD